MFKGEPYYSPAIVFNAVVEDGLAQYLTYKNNKIRNDSGDIVFDGMARSYYDNGQIKKEVNYTNDSKNGDEIFYDRNGNITNNSGISIPFYAVLGHCGITNEHFRKSK